MSNSPQMPYQVHELDKSSDLSFLKKLCLESNVCAVDTETTSNLKPDKKKNEEYYDWAQGARAFMSTLCPTEEHVFASYSSEVTEEILNFIDKNRVTQIYQNCKFDFHHLREWASYLPSSFEIPLQDTMFGFRLKYPRAKAGLKIASARFVPQQLVDSVDYWQMKVQDWLAQENALRAEGTLFSGMVVAEKANFSHVPKDIMLPYAAHDAYLTLRSYRGLAETGIFETPTYREELELSLLLVYVEKSGWRVKRDVLEHHINRARTEHQTFISSFSILCPGVDPMSNDQLIELLYNQMGETVEFKTDKGNPSVNEYAIYRITNVPLREALIGVRKWGKVLTTLQSLRQYTSDDGCVHSNLKNEAAKTGRFGSANPNLQNIPVFYEEDPWTHVRDIFGPEDGSEHLFADYKQIEMVLFADYCKDPSLDQAIINNEDLHTLTASKMFGFDPLTISKDELKVYRPFGKAMNFTIIYLAGEEKVAAGLKYGDADGTGAVTEQQIIQILGRKGTYRELARHLKNSYNKGFPTIKSYIDYVLRTLERRRPNPWIKNKFGRVIPVDAGYEYKGVNYLIQGTAADLMKVAMLRCRPVMEKFCEERSLQMWKDVQLFVTIHDDLGFKTPSGLGIELAKVIKPAMCDFPQFRLPIRADFSLVPSGSDWARKEHVEV
jgi:DNA polymerase I-like protein with 3'-5' exonuclease and polymerase domains